jgi:hypothetical protein
MTDRTIFAVVSLGALAIFLGAFARKAAHELARNPEHRSNDLVLAIFAGLSLAFQLLPLWVGAGLAAVIVKRIVVSVSTGIHLR